MRNVQVVSTHALSYRNIFFKSILLNLSLNSSQGLFGIYYKEPFKLTERKTKDVNGKRSSTYPTSFENLLRIRPVQRVYELLLK